MTAKRRVLLCATDAGGAANLAPLVPELVRAGAEVFVVTAQQFAARFDSARARTTTGVAPEQSESVVESVRPTAVIVGTTRYDSPDRRLLGISIERGIRSVAVLDERYLYRARFENEAGEIEAWPDVITLLDEESRAEAVAEGLPADRLRVTGSPALTELVKAARRMQEEPPPRPGVVSRAGRRPVITFLSETLSADYGSDPATEGPLGPFIGYTERSVLETLIETLAGLALDVALIDKRHPADENVIPNDGYIGRVHVATVRDEPLWPLLWHSSAVIGMRSIALLEAALLGVPAVSFQPGLIGVERCTAVRVGLVAKVATAHELGEWLAGSLGGDLHFTRRPAIANAFAPSDAARRIVTLALGSDL